MCLNIYFFEGFIGCGDFVIQILGQALAEGMRTLRQDGIEKVLQGLTDMSEVVAATNL